MSGPSRLTKFVRERTGTRTFAEADTARQVDVDLVSQTGPGTALMLRTAIALLVRCAGGTITIHGTLTSDETAAVRTEAEHYGAGTRVLFSESAAPPGALGINVVLGDGLFATAGAWVAAVNTNAPEAGWCAPPAATFAASCLIARWFLRDVLHQKVESENWTFSLWDFEVSGAEGELANGLELGELDLLGAGAIGSAFCFALKHAGWNARLRVIDSDAYEDPNHETTMMLRETDLAGAPAKSVLMQDRTKRPGLDVRPLVRRIVAGDPLLEERPSVLVCGVDNPETRRLLDRASTPVILNAGLGGSALNAGHVLFSAHGRTRKPLSALYPEGAVSAAPTTPPEEFREECSRISYESVSLAAPFMAMAAASLLLAGVALVALVRSVPSYRKFDLLGIQSSVDQG